MAQRRIINFKIWTGEMDEGLRRKAEAIDRSVSYVCNMAVEQLLIREGYLNEDKARSEKADRR